MQEGVGKLANEPWFADATTGFEEEGKATTDDQMTEAFHHEAPVMFADWTHRQHEFATLVESVHAYAPQGGADAFDTRAQLPTLRVPTLILAGAHDAIIAAKFSDELHAGIAGSQLVTLPDSGHMGHLEDPDAFAKAVLAFTSAH
jgi:pimeloyl-ACP methyl ester carboxylesterase